MPLGAGQGEHETRHATARSEVDAAAATLQSVDQREGRQRVEQVEARDRGRLGDPREIGAAIGRQQEGDEALGGIGEAGRQIDGTVREEALELDARSARVGPGLVGRGGIGQGQAKCSFERPFGLPGEWSASRPAFASAPSHPRLPYSVARRSRTVNLTARSCGSQPNLSTICAELHDLWITRPDILALDDAQSCPDGYDRGQVADQLTSDSPPRFAHESEAELARILDFYGVAWRYEPDVFPISWNADGAVIESFAPDFYLPEIDLYVELTTLKQSLVRKKNRKLRHLRQLYPEIRVKLFYARDFRALMVKYGRTGFLADLVAANGNGNGNGAAKVAAAAADEGAVATTAP